MNDFAYVAIIIAFFALAALFVKACDRIIGPDELSDAPRATTPSGHAPPAKTPGDPVGRGDARAA
jgi:hypothetical protein